MKTFDAEVQWKNPNILRPYENNAKQHPEQQVEKIARSIAAHGFDVPIVVDGDNCIIKGHGRTLAAIKLGLEKVPVIVRKDLSSTEIRAARLADNESAKSPYDEDILKFELKELDTLGLNMTLTGFESDELKKLLAFSVDPPKEETKEYPPCVAQPRDIWNLGEHNLIVGNTGENHDVDKVIREWQKHTKQDAVLDSTQQTFNEVQKSIKALTKQS